VDRLWQERDVIYSYNPRQDRFSLLYSVPITGIVDDYAAYNLAGHTFTAVPAPGHTPGSVAYLARIDGRTVAFTGDLIAAPGKLWSLAATQWTYNGAEGIAATILSTLDLKERGVDLLLPSHGAPMDDPPAAIDLLVERLWELLQHRQDNRRLFQWRENPFVEVTPHLLFNQTSVANSYVLLSESGKALFLDFGFDFFVGYVAGTDRAGRRPWLYNLPLLKERFGVQSIDVAIPTHFHDDHVAGFNLLRDVEGAQIWAAETFADVLEQPTSYDLTCLWYDPIPVDRRLPLEQPICWEEYELTLYHLPGHTYYAVAVSFEVDGKRVLAAGDQYQGADGLKWNYVYHNRFSVDDYRRSAELYARLNPDVILTGHWGPLRMPPGYYRQLEAGGEILERLHRELLPEEVINVGVEEFAARIRPYQLSLRGGETGRLAIEIRNPADHVTDAEVRLVGPERWEIVPALARVPLPALGSQEVHFQVTPPEDARLRRVRLAADISLDGRRLGQQAEALVHVENGHRGG
jgi:glyoxylase-like metal-dependent hydrolase (beta-lactamase superfamily II)